MTGPKKCLVLIGTRPEAIKLFPVVNRLRADARARVIVCATAQHRELLDQVLKLANITPDVDLDIMRPNQSLDQLSARLLLAIGEVLDQQRPDRVIVQGDTATAMIGALAAYYRRIPVSHVEAGLRSGDIYSPWPEEANRKIVSAIADQHFAPTERAAEMLRRENVPDDRVHVTGNTVIDALLATKSRYSCGSIISTCACPASRAPSTSRTFGLGCSGSTIATSGRSRIFSNASAIRVMPSPKFSRRCEVTRMIR